MRSADSIANIITPAAKSVRATQQVEKVRAMAPGAYLYELYEARITALVDASPGSDWDGVTNFDDK